jgi:M6 family metalloprotease-like protein
VRRRWRWVLVGECTVALLASQAVTAQDPPRVPGLTLPRAALERIRRQPDFFQIRDGWIARTARAQQQGLAVADTLRVVVIHALFADSPEPHVTHEMVQRALFDGPSEYGTASEFYAETSGGRFALTGRALPWVRTSLTMTEVVGEEYGLGDDAQTGTYLLDALEAVDTLVDFGLFDNDGPDGVPNSGDDDGAVDAVAFQFLEVAASCGGPSIWPHRSRMQGWSGEPFTTSDSGFGGTRIVVNDYVVQSAVDCGGIDPQKATTIAHELGHVLGLPDLYDRSQGILPEERRWVVGCWSLMAAGAWGCGVQGRETWVRPTHLGPWEKIRLGWIGEVEDVVDVFDEGYTLEPIQTSERVLHIPLENGAEADTNEYLLVEYRTQEGFDLDLPASGVMIYHVDPEIPGNQPCAECAQVYRVGVLEADANNSLRLNFLQGGNRGEAGDAWGVSGLGELTHRTEPSTRTTWGWVSPVMITDIRIADGRAHLTISSAFLDRARMAQAFVQSGALPLTAAERAYLDWFGNGNGQFDVGDLRAYLKR